MSDTARLVTAEELEKFSDDDYRYELVAGRLVRMSPVGYRHSRVVIRLGARLEQHATKRRLGVVVTELGFKLKSNPDTVRAPDLAFIREGRIPPNPRGFWNGSPDLAIEVLSPDDTAADVHTKVREYLVHGVALVVVVDPEEQTVTVSRPLGEHSAVASGVERHSSQRDVRLTLDGVLDLGEVVPGFTCPVRELFTDL